LNDVDEQDVGCYGFFMPHNSKEPLYYKCVDLDDICPFTIKGFCTLLPLIQFFWCAILMAVATFLFRK
jgi:hypothetical protein